MKAIFFAAGPDITAGVQLKPFENVNILSVYRRDIGSQRRR